jgi:hypothetical protein
LGAAGSFVLFETLAESPPAIVLPKLAKTSPTTIASITNDLVFIIKPPYFDIGCLDF